MEWKRKDLSIARWAIDVYEQIIERWVLLDCPEAAETALSRYHGICGKICASGRMTALELQNKRLWMADLFGTIHRPQARLALLDQVSSQLRQIDETGDGMSLVRVCMKLADRYSAQDADALPNKRALLMRALELCEEERHDYADLTLCGQLAESLRDIGEEAAAERAFRRGSDRHFY